MLENYRHTVCLLLMDYTRNIVKTCFPFQKGLEYGISYEFSILHYYFLTTAFPLESDIKH